MSSADNTKPEKKIEQRLDETIAELKEFKIMVRGMTNEFIERLTDAKREIRKLRRTQKKPKDPKKPKKPCHFEVPTDLSDELCDFLGLEHGSQMARNAVTHNISVYCVKNGLLDEDNRQNIAPDDKLKSILKGWPEDTQLTFLNLQRYIKHHYASAAQE